MLKILKTRKGWILILSILALLSSYPYVFECLMPIPPIQVTGPFFFLIFAAIWVVQGGILGIPKFLGHCLAIQAFVWLLYSAIHNDTTYITRIFYVVWTAFMISVLFRNKVAETYVNFHNNFVALQAILSLVTFALVVMNILEPIIMYKLTNGQDGFCYILSCTNFAGYGFIRAAGYFDEPGALAFWGVYALLFNKLFFNNKRVEYCLLIGLFSTLSAAYFIQLSLYLLLFKIKDLKKQLLPILLFVGLILFSWSHFSDIDIIQKYTTDRFQNGEIRTTRYELAEKAKKQFQSNPLFGVGGETLNSGEYMDDNPYEILAKDGMIGLVVTYLPLIIVMMKCRKKEFLLATIILIAGYMQRPFHLNLIHFLHLYLFCLFGYYKYSKTYERVST